MTRKRVRSRPERSAMNGDFQPQAIPAVGPIAVEPTAIGDDVYDPRSDSERFPMPEDLPPPVKPAEARDSSF